MNNWKNEKNIKGLIKFFKQKFYETNREFHKNFKKFTI